MIAQRTGSELPADEWEKALQLGGVRGAEDEPDALGRARLAEPGEGVDQLGLCLQHRADVIEDHEQSGERVECLADRDGRLIFVPGVDSRGFQNGGAASPLGFDERRQFGQWRRA
ncbi:hypothetical protein [Actinomadura chibensis]|uniref:hypothetical protein n=1 Tax=Actinomadura chibensis TaxID=392828 RepID=UPI0012F99FA8|nr:hypothetical protein [Actinomadura chibensis]